MKLRIAALVLALAWPGLARAQTAPIPGVGNPNFSTLGVFPATSTTVLTGPITLLQQPINSFVSYTGTPGVDATYQYHSFITNDAVHHTAASNAIAGSFQLKLNTGFTGSRIGLDSSINLLGQSGSTNANSIIALRGDITGTANQGGTSPTLGNAAGSIWAGLFNASLLATATNYALYQGVEIDMNAVGTTFRKHALQISLGPADINRGAVFDAAFVMGNSILSAGTWLNGALFGEDSSRWPFFSDSSLITAKMGVDDVLKPAVAAFGMDFVDVTFGTAFLRSNGFSVDGSGNLQIGTGYLQPVSGGLTIDTKGAVGNTASGAGMIVSGGSGWAGGEVLTDPYGGRYKVSSVAGDVITALTVYRQPIFPTTTTPANPVTLGLRSGTDSVAPTINISWNTTGNTLSLQPSGGGLKVGGTGPITGFGSAIGQALGPLSSLGGIAALNTTGKLIFNAGAPSNVGGTDFFFRRDGSSLTGGSNQLNLFVNVTQSVAAADDSRNWAFSSVIQTANTLQRNAVGGDFQAVRLSGNGSLFALIAESRDQTGLSSAASGSPFGEASAEFDLTSTGLDDAVNPSSFGGFGIRNFAHYVADTWQGIVAPHEVAHGLWFGTSHGSYIDSVIAFDLGGGGGAQIRAALDTRNAVTVAGSGNPVSAVVMTAGHVIDFNGGAAVTSAPGNYLWYDSGSSRWKYTIAGVDKFSVDASGNVRAAGTVTGSTTP